ncbi:hypothetical protein [Halobacillus hunanensis]|uniref:hypothetical protein n=1 Tax=Halobacillus hunanensis TaxID=578214 RepID=UPI0009A5E7B1|nr:hypothetical protein [Halobacillus hunanensis]
MKKYFLAVTYDVCEHNELFEHMNEYPLESSVDMENQVRNFAKLDVAPLVQVYKSETSDFQELKLHKEFKFKEYECGCNEETPNDES